MRRLSTRWMVVVGFVLCYSWSYWAQSKPKTPPRRTAITKRRVTVTKRITPKRTFTRRLGKKIWRRCGSCHVTASWKKIKSNSAFDHSLTGFPLHGKHKQTSCSRCHNSGTKKSAKGRPSHFQSAAKRIRSCRSCHRSPHKNTVSRDCGSCHNTLTWKKNRLFLRHQRTLFPLTGAHASTPCISCHVNKEQQGYRKLSTRCVTCHATAYTRAGNHPNHVTAGFSKDCRLCHATYSWRPAQVNHNKWWPLIGAHATTACSKCHVNNQFKGTSKDCFSCHSADYNRAKHNTSSQFGQQCITCHTQNAWKPATFASHKFPITSGNHAGLQCSQCHTTTTTYKVFSCLAPCHAKAKTDSQHVGKVTGYLYESLKCYSCHPQGN